MKQRIKGNIARQTKVYWEHLALLSLKYFGYNIDNFTDGESIEKPDLQNEKENIGVEVVQAIFQENEDIRGYRKKYIKSYMPLQQITKCLSEKGYEKNIITSKGEFRGIVLEIKYVSDVINIVCEKIKEKIQKKQQYKPFKTYGLYIFLDRYASKLLYKDIKILLKEIQKINGYKEFNYYFINSYEHQFCINTHTSEISTIIIPNQDRQKIIEQALLFELNNIM